MPQGHGIFRTLSVARQPASSAPSSSGTRPSSPDGSTAIFGLFPILKERAGQIGGTLSGGQQQMLAIGMALMHGPRVLILDEPSIGLAPNLVERVMQSIVTINREFGTSILMVEQNVALSLPIASRAVVIKTGAVVYEGEPGAAARPCPPDAALLREAPMPQRWKRRPEGSTWGDFGPDDENGRIGLLTPDRVRAAIAEVREGRTFCLSLPLDYPGGNVLNPHRHPPRLFATERRGKPTYNYVLADERELWTDVVSDDAVLLHTQYSTQWDSLAHVGGLFDADGDGAPEVVYYNGWRGGDDVVGPAVGSRGEGCSALRRQPCA